MRRLLSINIVAAILAAAQPAAALAGAVSVQDRRNFEAGLLDSPNGPVYQTIRRFFLPNIRFDQ
ncbi:MAG: hypothetical protein H0W74_14440 [Sphingosinicella sp.]|nr:hypothetical protein [Sphingosinicella sp.]